MKARCIKIAMVLWVLGLLWAQDRMVTPVILVKEQQYLQIILDKALYNSLPEGYRFTAYSKKMLAQWIMGAEKVEEKALPVADELVVPSAYYCMEGKKYRGFLSLLSIELKPCGRMKKVVNLSEKGERLDVLFEKLFVRGWEKLKKAEEIKGGAKKLLLYRQGEEQGIPGFLPLNYMLEAFKETGQYSLTLPDLYSQKLGDMLRKFQRGGLNVEKLIENIGGLREKPQVIVLWEVVPTGNMNVYNFTQLDIKARKEERFSCLIEGKKVDVPRQSRLIAYNLYYRNCLGKVGVDCKSLFDKLQKTEPVPVDFDDLLREAEKDRELRKQCAPLLAAMLLDARPSFPDTEESASASKLVNRLLCGKWKKSLEALANWIAKDGELIEEIAPICPRLREIVQVLLLARIIEKTPQSALPSLWERTAQIFGQDNDMREAEAIMAWNGAKTDLRERLLSELPADADLFPLYRKALLSGERKVKTMALNKIAELPSHETMPYLWHLLQNFPQIEKEAVEALAKASPTPQWLPYILDAYPKLQPENKGVLLGALKKIEPSYSFFPLFRALKNQYRDEPELLAYFFEMESPREEKPLPKFTGPSPDEFPGIWHEERRNAKKALLLALALRIKKLQEIAYIRENIYSPESQIREFQGFAYIGKNAYSCGGQTHTVKEYRHEQTGMVFVLIPGGEFLMGSENGNSDERPVHKVRLSEFLMAKTELTQGVWKKVMGNNPSKFKKGDNYPVENVSWEDCQEFCKKTGLNLPTEAEWEYACRAGSSEKYCFSDSESTLGEYAWYNENSGSKTHAVGQKKPNAFGLYDMHGNVWEWCADWYGGYAGRAQVEPTGPYSGSLRVCRGGSWSNEAGGLRSAYRNWYEPSSRSDSLGARLFFREAMH